MLAEYDKYKKNKSTYIDTTTEFNFVTSLSGDSLQYWTLVVVSSYRICISVKSLFP